jgi:hypothetical protein
MGLAALVISPRIAEGRHMQTHETSVTGTRAAKAVARDRGVSDVTVWRWGKRGWIKIVNICGRPYVDLASLAEFDERARKGEFAAPPSGAAGASSKARVEKRLLNERQ